jgi:cystathionine gamma-synthase
MKPETAAIHAGNFPDNTNHPVIQSITLSSTFSRNEPGNYMYSRAANPNRDALEHVLAALEFGKDAAAFSSGNAAGMAVFQALEPGSHVLLPNTMYHGLRWQVETLFQGILEFTFADMLNLTEVKERVKANTRLIWIETPSNPLIQISDITSLADLAKSHGILSVCDNTFASPVFQNPLKLGADLVMHSSTKFLSGHSDILGGALITAEHTPFWERIRNVQRLGGAIPSPFDCYLLVRSVKTLFYRMKGHEANALKLAEFLSNHQRVERVLYPGLPNHEGHEVAKKQMSGFGAVLSFLVKGGQTEADGVVSRLKFFTHATSLGGVESLIERRASVEGPDTKTPQNLLRISVGLEHIDDLMADIDKALNSI